MGWEGGRAPSRPARAPRPHPAPARSATGARLPATHFSPRPRPGMRGAGGGSQPRTPRRPRGTCGSGSPSSFGGHCREGPAAGGGGGRGPWAPPARRRMPLSAPLLACHLAGARSVMECGPVGKPRRRPDRGPLAPSLLRGRARCFSSQSRGIEVPCGWRQNQSIVFNKREKIVVSCCYSSRICTSFI